VGGLQLDEYLIEIGIGGGCTKCLEPKTLALNCEVFSQLIFSMHLCLLWHWLKSRCYVLINDLFLLTWLIMRYSSRAVFVTGSIFTDFIWYLTQPFNPIVLGSSWTSLPHSTCVHPSGDMWPVFQQWNKQVEVGLLFHILPGIFTIM